MKTVLSTAAVAMLASQAFAHGEGHLHPHGTEITPILVGLAIAASAYVLMRRR